MIRVQELHVYPLKSARGIAKEWVRLTDTGLEWDRHWMAVRADGAFLSQRTHPALARIETEVTGTELLLRSAGFERLTLPLEARGLERTVRVWKDSCPGLDQGDEPANWVSAVLGEPVRLVRMPAVPGRQANPDYAGPRPVPVSFADGFPILVCNRASLDDLNARLPEALPMERFRPNVVLEGLPPYAEDRIAAIRVGSVTLSLVKPCTRCIIPSMDQRTGVRGTDPLPVLRQYRFDKTLRGVTFGENAIVTAGAGTALECGTQCQVTFDA